MAVLPEARLQANSDITYFLDNWFGSHEFKAGVNVELASDSTEEQLSSGLPISKASSPRDSRPSTSSFGKASRRGPGSGTEHNQKNRADPGRRSSPGHLVPDPRQLTLNIGVRYDYAQGAYPPQKKKGTDVWVNRKAMKAMTFNMFSPRLGVSFDPFGNGKTVIRANYGRYYAPLIMIYYYFNNPNQTDAQFWANLNPDWTVNYTTPPWTPGLNSVDSRHRIALRRRDQPRHRDGSSSRTSRSPRPFIGKWEKNIIDDVESHLDIAKWKRRAIWFGRAITR